MKKKFLVVFVLLAFVTPVMADDLYPPDFRGDPLSYEAHWDAFTNGGFSSFYPDYENAVDDSDPATTLFDGLDTHLGFTGTGWAITLEGGGFYNDEGPAGFVAYVVNWIDEMPHKFLRIQVTYADMLGNGPPAITNMTGVDPTAVGGPYFGDRLDRYDEVLGPYHEYYYEDWVFEPNPDWENIWFTLPLGTIVDQIVIDTVSVPEPATMSILALGGLAVLRRRRR